jgi:maleamate amidohydrolase
VIVTGCTTSGCVRATTVDSFSNGFRTLVPEDCVGDQGNDAHFSNLRDVHRRYAEVTSSDEVIAYLESVREPAAARR